MKVLRLQFITDICSLLSVSENKRYISESIMTNDISLWNGHTLWFSLFINN